MENKKKRRGMLALLLGLALTVCGGALLTRSGGQLEYILPAPAATQEGGELNALYEEAQKQLASIADSVTASAVGARAQGLTLSTETQSAQTTVYAVGSGYFDVAHETLLDGRLISEADVKRAEDAIVIDESTALTFFAGDEPVGKTVTLDGLNYEVAGVIRTSRRLGETDEHVAYIPITAASANALAMQTVELTAKTAVNAALSGHLVLSTVHATSVYGIWQRMINLGISSEELEQTMRLASYQRLIPRKNGGSSVLFDFLDIDELEESICENSGKNRQMTKEWGERLGICVKNGEIAEETASMFLQG